MQFAANNAIPGINAKTINFTPLNSSGGTMQDRDRADLEKQQKTESKQKDTNIVELGKCRIFPANAEQNGNGELRALSESIRTEAGQPTHNCHLSAGYVFLSQFIEHDITRLENPANWSFWQDLKRRTLDLESVYGDGENSNLLRDVASPDQMIVGKSVGTGDFNVNHSLPSDLPRIVSGARPGKALIGDPRNDINLGVAQTHLLFLKLHNRFVELGMNYAEARKATTQHYQSMVINDFLVRILDPNVFNGVLKQPSYVCFMPLSDYIPLEFIMAAYRFAYSMLSPEYEWNSIYNTGGLAGTIRLEQLYQYSEFSGNLGGQTRLPTHWVVDWRHFYDFSADGEMPRLNMANRVGASLIADLDPLIEQLCQPNGDSKNLALRMLQLGKKYQLASGQTVVDILNERGMMLHKLEAEQLGIDPAGLRENTPLWYYVMRESQLQQNGKRLGEVGSWLVADTFKKLLLDSPCSVLNDPEFTPHPQILNGRKIVTMPGIIEFVGDIKPLLYPD